jgi:hypothetical protein
MSPPATTVPARDAVTGAVPSNNGSQLKVTASSHRPWYYSASYSGASFPHHGHGRSCRPSPLGGKTLDYDGAVLPCIELEVAFVRTDLALPQVAQRKKFDIRPRRGATLSHLGE